MRVVTSIFYKRGENPGPAPDDASSFSPLSLRLSCFIVVNRTYIHVLLYRSTAKEDVWERFGSEAEYGVDCGFEELVELV